MNTRLPGAFVLAALLVTGCDSRAPKVASSSAPAPAGSAREDAALLAARGDHAGAERKYREALTAHPDDLELHFGLASVLTQLDRRDEAIAEFRWVVANGRSGRPEVDTARRWLVDAGAAAPSSSPAPVAAAVEASGGIAGKLVWPGLPPEKTFGIRVVVERDGEGGMRKTVRTKLNGTYAVEGLTDGSYKLTGLAGPVRIWSDVPVTVSGGQKTTLDLSPANATVSAAEFPAR